MKESILRIHLKSKWIETIPTCLKVKYFLRIHIHMSTDCLLNNEEESHSHQMISILEWLILFEGNTMTDSQRQEFMQWTIINDFCKFPSFLRDILKSQFIRAFFLSEQAKTKKNANKRRKKNSFETVQINRKEKKKNTELNNSYKKENWLFKKCIHWNKYVYMYKYFQ